MKTKKSLIILGIAFLFLISLSIQGSAETTENNDMEIAPMLYLFIFGIALSLVSLFTIFFYNPRLGVIMFIIGISIILIAFLFSTYPDLF